ncbi:MAG: CBO0543 family protein [Bacillota bacterium]|nr:CBO0543 family protein [Bacillota bacterium]
MTDRKLLKLLWSVGLFLAPTLFMRPTKDRWIVFLFNAFLNTYIDNYLVASKRLKYPNRLKSVKKLSNGSVLYDSLLCPLMTTWYYIATRHVKKISKFLFITFLFVLPQLIFELLLEKYTEIIKYKKGWKWYHSFFTISFIKIFVRGFIQMINKASQINS